MLYTPNFKEIFFCKWTPAEWLLGVVLFQQMQGEEQPITYASRKLPGAETRYSTIEQELICSGVKLFRYYLLGRKFILFMDHSPLKWLQSSKTDNAHIMTW